MIVRCKCSLAPGPLAGSGGAAPSGTFLEAPLMAPPLRGGMGYSSGLRPGKEDTRGKLEGYKASHKGKLEKATRKRCMAV